VQTKSPRTLAAIVVMALPGTTWCQNFVRQILPGDAIRIACEEDPDLCARLIVSPDGSIRLPRLGSVGVATLAPPEISAKIRLLWQDQTGQTQTVLVTPCFTPGAPIEISGAVKHSMKFRYVHPPTLQKLVEIADPTDQADTVGIPVSHADGSCDTVELSRPYQLRDGDRVTVSFATQAHTVEVTGGVQTPAHLKFLPGMSVSDALAAAGGIAARGNPARISVVRLGEPIPIALLQCEKFQLVARDEVRVDVAARIRHVLVQGHVKHPGLTDYTTGMTVTQAIAAAGGIEEFSRADSVFLTQAMKGSQSAARLSLRYLYSHRIPDPILCEDDVIQVGAPDNAKKR
jgi:protein involved in polysaccharide export with SLBB domain